MTEESNAWEGTVCSRIFKIGEPNFEGVVHIMEMAEKIVGDFKDGGVLPDGQKVITALIRDGYLVMRFEFDGTLRPGQSVYGKDWLEEMHGRISFGSSVKGLQDAD